MRVAPGVSAGMRTDWSPWQRTESFSPHRVGDLCEGGRQVSGEEPKAQNSLAAQSQTDEGSGAETRGRKLAAATLGGEELQAVCKAVTTRRLRQEGTSRRPGSLRQQV